MNNKFPKIDLNKLINLYTSTDMFIYEICNELDVSYKTVYKWIKRLNLTRNELLIKKVQNRKYENQRNSVYNKYGVYNVSKLNSVNISKSVSMKKLWSNKSNIEKEQMVDKVRHTKSLRYNNPNYNNIQKGLKTKQLRYGSSQYNNTLKGNATRRLRRTSGKSKDEIKFKQLLIDKYTENNIQVQQQILPTSRYRYDFYVQSDLLIELNGEFWHNYRPYKNTPEHQIEYNQMRIKGGMYSAIAKHWKYDDVNKLNLCIKNNLNLIVIYFDKIPNNIIEYIDKYKFGITIITVKNSKIMVQRLSKT